MMHLAVPERCDLLYFVGDMCESTVLCHRLLGVELIGEVMCQGWCWRDAERGGVAHQAFTPSSSIGEGAHKNAGGEGGGIARALSGGLLIASSRLLSCLQGRLSDKSPTVRTRAALSLGEMAYVRPNILDVQENVIRVFFLSPVKRYSLHIPLILQCTFM